VVSRPLDQGVPDDRAVGTARGVVALTAADGSTICERCVVADRMLPRMKGLLGRRELASGEGMLIRRAASIHTFFMRFAIDAVFLSRDGEVLKVAENVGAWRARFCRRAHSVLELPAGEAARRNLAVGMSLEARMNTAPT
jgi:uncharacterized membrane protein (UPF0127 family)